MIKNVLVNAGSGELRVAVVEDGVVEQLVFERTIGFGDAQGLKRERGLDGARQSIVGDIILGRVQRVLPSMQAAFVNIGLERAGFLAAREARPRAATFHDDPYTDEERHLNIAEYVREGQDIVVQVVKDPIADKGARLSTNITLPGRLLILVANSAGVTLSRRITDEGERKRLTGIIEGFGADTTGDLLKGAGYIIRTAAIGMSLEELREDAARLSKTWNGVAARIASTKVPSMLYSDLGPVERALRDEADKTVSRIIFDDALAYQAARDYVARAMPEMLDKLEIYNDRIPLFESWGVEEDIAQLTETRVPLPSGGWITIESTEALTAIDVNSGSYIDGAGLEETSFKVNLEAATAIGRQLRLRGIGGLIVIDFIHLSFADNITRVLEGLKAACAKDRVPVQVLGMSEFGLVEMTRKRVRDPLVKRVTEDCRRCHGHGRRKTLETVVVEILRRTEAAAIAVPGKAIAVHASPVVIRWLEDHEDEIRVNLARRGVTRLVFQANNERMREVFDVVTSG